MSIHDRPWIEDLALHADDRGSLYEVVHAADLPLDVRYPLTHPADPALPWPGPPPRFGQVYVVRSPARGTIRGLHRHRVLWDYFTVVQGRAKVVVARTREPDHAVEDLWRFVLTAEKPQRLAIPPSLWHGWVSLVDDTILLATGTEVYDRAHPDEERITHDAFGRDVWEVKPR